jgi:pimeloyl-ACP methyl ester carboxylesterase
VAGSSAQALAQRSRIVLLTAALSARPTRWFAGEISDIVPPRFGRSFAAEIPNARFELMPGEAHEPFQEVPDEFIARVDAFWRELDAGA